MLPCIELLIEACGEVYRRSLDNADTLLGDEGLRDMRNPDGLQGVQYGDSEPRCGPQLVPGLIVGRDPDGDEPGSETFIEVGVDDHAHHVPVDFCCQDGQGKTGGGPGVRVCCDHGDQ